MDVTVSSRQVEVSPKLKSTAIEKVGRLERYLDEMERAEVHFSEERNPRIENKEVCEVTLHGSGHIVRAKVAAADQFAAIDLAVSKLEHQLHKLKTRIVDRHNGKVKGPKAAPADSSATSGDAEGQVVKVKRFVMKPMTVDEAVLQMDMLGHEFFYFLHADSGDTAVVYRRADGDIGLIEAAK
ncbi:MAG TPA: ribosome-associated translation inhibitor RaiA [Acidimicrobiales bacterium]